MASEHGSTTYGTNGKLGFHPEEHEAPGAPEPQAPAGEPGGKAKAAASLTADVVARGKQRRQAYGEAGLWRGAAPPPAAEAPVRMVLPPAPGSEPERDDSAAAEAAPRADAERRVDAAAPLAVLDARRTRSERSKDMGDLAFYLVCGVLVLAAGYLLSLLLR